MTTIKIVDVYQRLVQVPRVKFNEMENPKILMAAGLNLWIVFPGKNRKRYYIKRFCNIFLFVVFYILFL